MTCLEQFVSPHLARRAETKELVEIGCKLATQLYRLGWAVQPNWVKGHSGIFGNYMVDKMADMARSGSGVYQEYLEGDTANDAVISGYCKVAIERRYCMMNVEARCFKADIEAKPRTEEARRKNAVVWAEDVFNSNYPLSMLALIFVAGDLVQDTKIWEDCLAKVAAYRKALEEKMCQVEEENMRQVEEEESRRGGKEDYVGYI